MSRIVAAALAVVGTALGVPVPALAAETAATTACTVTDDRVIGLSGLLVTGGGFIGVSDSNVEPSKVRIWYLDQHCHVIKSVRYPTHARDPEDAAMGRDGTLYVADIGDNDRTRLSIAVWRLRPGQATPKIFRYAYPDGPHDAEAVLLAADDSPIFVTKDPAVAGLYAPTGPADPSGRPVPLKKVGTFTLTPTDTVGGVGSLGGFVVTGGAESPDRRRAVLRSYSDAYEWDVPDGDVVAAITTTKPRITPLPGEPQGESIAYGPGGTAYYTVSDQENQPVRARVLRYPAPAAAAATAAATATPGPPAAGRPTKVSALGAALIAAITGGVILVGLAMWGALRVGRRPSGAPPP